MPFRSKDTPNLLPPTLDISPSQPKNPHSHDEKSLATDKISPTDSPTATRLPSASASDDDPDPSSFAHLNLKAIHRKMDLRIIPMLTILYLLSFLDRGNIGNANIVGLSEDLRLTGQQYNWCLTAFFFTYSAFEVPSNMVLKRLRPSVWLPCEFLLSLSLFFLGFEGG
jgi:hypothetical protein